MAQHETNPQVFAERIKLLRSEKKLTQKQMAQILGISERSYQSFEGGRYFPSNNTMLSIINNFGMDVLNYLIGVTDTIDTPKG